MRKKDKLAGIITEVNFALPKTVQSIDTVVSNLIVFLDILLTPIKMFKEYSNYKFELFKRNLQKKINRIPDDQRKDNLELNIVGPACENLKYLIFNDELGEMFENLLASSLNKNNIVFPGFVDIIRQLNSDEAKLLKYIAHNGTEYPLIDLRYVDKANGEYIVPVMNYTNIGNDICEKPELITAYLNDLERFGLITIPFGEAIFGDGLYSDLESDPFIQSEKEISHGEIKNGFYKIHKKSFEVTRYGTEFLKSCVLSTSNE